MARYRPVMMVMWSGGVGGWGAQVSKVADSNITLASIQSNFTVMYETDDFITQNNNSDNNNNVSYCELLVSIC